MNMLWISVLFIIALQIIPIGKPQPKNMFDRVLSGWSNKLMRLSAVDKNWLTSADPQCTDVMDFVCGNCVVINHMESDSSTEKQLFESSAFYVLCYTLVRRFLEIFGLYMARWMPLVCACVFVFSGAALSTMYFMKKNSKRRRKKGNSPLSKSSLFLIFGFCLSSLAVSAVILPVVADYILGDVLNKELESFQDETNEFAIERVFRGEREKGCSTLLGFFDFRCLRRTMFDLEASGVKELVPPCLPLNEKICVQMQIIVINAITVFAFCILYGIPVIVLYMIIRFFKGRLKSRMQKLSKPRSSIKNSNKHKDIPVLAKDISEQCKKTTVKPGMKNPWQELNFSTNIEDHLDRFIQEETEYKNIAINRKKSERGQPVIPRTPTPKTIKYSTDGKAPKRTEKILCPIKGPKRYYNIEIPSLKRPRLNEETRKEKTDSKIICGSDVLGQRSCCSEKLTMSPSIKDEKNEAAAAVERTIDAKVSYKDAETNVCFDSEDDSEDSYLSSD